MSRFFRRLAARKTRQEAIVAAARKMLKVMYWMFRDGSLTIRVGLSRR